MPAVATETPISTEEKIEDPMLDNEDEDEDDDDDLGLVGAKTEGSDNATEVEIPPLGDDEVDAPADTKTEATEIKPGTLAETLKLDEAIPEEFRKRILEHAEGIDKLAQRFQEQETAKAEEWKEKDAFYGQSLALADALDDTEAAPAILARLIVATAKTHGLDAEDLSYELYEWIEADKIPDIKPKAKTESKPDPEIEKLKAKVTELENSPAKKAEETKAKADAADKRVEGWLDTNAPQVIAHAEKQFGWKVTRDQIKTAVTAHKSDKPLDALKKSFPDEYRKAGEDKARNMAPGMLPTASRKGSTRSDKPASEYSARDAYLELGLSKT